MPKALGDDYFARLGPNRFASLTRVQYAVLKRWADGEFVEDWDPQAFGAIEPTITAEGLDRAALENSVGGPFFPGIDCSWMIRNPQLYGSAFRIKQSGVVFPETAKLSIQAGFFSQQMALPWQADFYQCKKERFPTDEEDATLYAEESTDTEGMYHMWWCAHRPDDVYVELNEKDKQAIAEKQLERKMVPWTRAFDEPAKKEESTNSEIQARVANPKTEDDHDPLVLAYYIQMQKNWSQLNFVIRDGTDVFETTAVDPVDVPQPGVAMAYALHKSGWLYRIDLHNAATQPVGSLGVEFPSFGPLAIFGDALYTATLKNTLGGDPVEFYRFNLPTLRGLMIKALDLHPGHFAAYQGTLYGCTSGGPLIVDPFTGAVTRIGTHTSSPLTSAWLYSFAVRADGTAFALLRVGRKLLAWQDVNVESTLGRLDLRTGTLQPIGVISSQSVMSIAFHGDTLYGLTLSGDLLQIDLATGAGKLVGRTGLGDWRSLATPNPALPVPTPASPSRGGGGY
jgi:hypothetical protein